MTHVGKNVKSLRLKNGWNQKLVAEKLKISIPAYSKIEACITDINLTRLGELATIFNTSAQELLSTSSEYVDALQVELNLCKNLLVEKENEVSKLQKKVIELFDELRSK